MAGPSPPLIVLRRAAFGYGGRPVLSGVDLDVAPGAFVGIVGPNGAGKTTLIRGVLGLLPPLEGTLERTTRRLGYVPQRESLDSIFPLNVEEVVHTGCYGRLSGAMRRLPREEHELAARSLERVGLHEERRSRFNSLSGGQRQRVLIARALAMRPRVLILDEPTSGVDRPTRKLILDLLMRLNREEDLAILLVSHQLAMTREAVKQVLWVSDGRVVAGTGEDVLRPEQLDELFGQDEDDD